MVPTQQRARPVRPSRQPRTEKSLAKIATAVTAILADEGPGALTHRRVAEVAGVSLASTTYHYENKFEMITEATERLLEEYVRSFVRLTEQHRLGSPVVADLPALILKLLANAAGRHGQTTLAWCEIMLDCARTTEGHVLARRWLSQMDRVWTELVSRLGLDEPADIVGPAIDTVMGLLYLTKSLGLSTDQIFALFRDKQSLEEVIGDAPPDAGGVAPAPVRPMNKALQTRERILGSAVKLLADGEHGPLSYRAVAEQSGITSAAVAYHFPTSETLQDAAQRRIFALSLGHHEQAIAEAAVYKMTRGSPADLAAAIFVRQVTQFGPLHLASFSVWLDATRKDGSRPLIASSARRMIRHWARWLEGMGAPERADYPLFALGHFIGKSIRLLSTGVAITDLAPVRSEFEWLFRHFVRGTCPFAA